MMSSKKTITDADRALFRNAVKGTSRLRHDYAYLESAKPSMNHPVQPSQSEPKVAARLHDLAFPEDLPEQETLCFQRSGIHRNTLRKLRRGQLPIFAELDLHGQTVDQARNAVAQLLDSPHPVGYIARIIHGRGLGSPQGKGILKAHVAYWLHQHPRVLAYCSALPQHGGVGAVYVLLKNDSKNN